MRWFYILVFLLFASVGSTMAQPSPSPSPTPSSPGADSIKLVACSLDLNKFNGLAAKLHVDFINLTSEPLTHIRFRVEAGLGKFAVMDIGTFAPNVKIHHDLDPPEITLFDRTKLHKESEFRRDLFCAIDAYTLQSGYTWVSPRLQQELSQPQTSH